MELKETTISCPQCGHPMHISLDYSNGDQDYYEECSNCCNSVHLNMHIDYLRKKLDVNVSREDE